MRAPVGGLFRHVCDLARGQAERGHEVGIIVDSTANDSLTERRLSDLATNMSLGIHRVAMARDIDWRDLTATRATLRHAAALDVDVIHGHGAKGGAYARLAAAALKRHGRAPAAIYTPHGGSLHYSPASLKGRIFMGLERRLASLTDGIVFESAFAARTYAAHVRLARPVTTRVIANGVGRDEFDEISPAADAADFVFVGELRQLKGVDILLEAMARLQKEHAATAVIVGEGPDAASFKALAHSLGLADRVRFPGAMPARQAFALGRTLVMPSRAESLPYVVLEAGAAALPIIASDVGGIPEIVAGSTTRLQPSGDVQAFSEAMLEAIIERDLVVARARALQAAIGRGFTIDAMTTSVLNFYRQVSPN
ncbi:MAG: glycosyltransferase family 4 protein [Hyphomicrobiaceae bacterium]|nr:glycosyltransferase family 4 protein [Hyphomicrobiaceae bacterium]